MHDLQHTFQAIKDEHSTFICCNETFAKKAGLDSPQQIIGKTDYDLAWHEDADTYVASDQIALSGQPYLNKIEQQLGQKILISKCLINDAALLTPQIQVSFVNANQLFNHDNGHTNCDNQFVFTLNDRTVVLPKQQALVFKYTILGYNTLEISKLMQISHRTVEAHTNRLKYKLGVSRKSSIVTMAWLHNTTHIVDLLA